MEKWREFEIEGLQQEYFEQIKKILREAEHFESDVTQTRRNLASKNNKNQQQPHDKTKGRPPHNLTPSKRD